MELPEAITESQQPTGTAARIPGAARAKVLVVSGDTLPFPGYATTGAGLRAWGLGEGLRSQGHEVVYAMPGRCAKEDRPLPEGAVLLYEDADLPRMVETAAPDVLVFQHWFHVPTVGHLDIPIAIDFHGPLILEMAFQRMDPNHLSAMMVRKIHALRRGDFFTCAGELQKKYFFGWLLQAGADLTEEIIYAIPVSLGPDLPEHSWPEEEVNFVYGGVFLPWQDPSVGIKMLLKEMKWSGRGRLDFFGGKHTWLNTGQGIYEELEPLLAASPHVRMHGMVPRDELVQRYRTSYVALDVMARNYERELAFTTRTVEYLWCGLAVVYADYGELTPLIREYEAGWIVSPEDPEGVAQTLREILASPQEARRRGRNAQHLARERLNWERTVGPLAAFCRDPRRRMANIEMASAPTPALPSEMRLRHRLLRGILEKAGVAGLYRKTPENFRLRMRDIFGVNRHTV